MTTARQRRFLLAYLGGTLAVVAGLSSLDALSLELAASLSVLVLFAVTTLTAPVHVLPAWRRRLRWPLAGAGAVFLALAGYTTLQKFLAAL